MYLGVSKNFTAKTTTRSKKCLELVQNHIELNLNSNWLRHYFARKNKKIESKIVESIKETFKTILENASWLDVVSKAAALMKLEKMTSFVGYPEEIIDDETLKKHFERVSVNESQLFENMLQLNKFYHYNMRKKLKKSSNESDWQSHSRVSVINAFYEPTENMIRNILKSFKFLDHKFNFLLEIPAGILQGDFFNVSWMIDPRLEYLNHVSLGFTVGHELTHGFDTTGGLFDFEGTLKDWWTDSTKNVFHEKVQCLVKQYDSFIDPLSKLNMNGSKTLTENIADIGRMKFRGNDKYAKFDFLFQAV